MIKTIDDGYVQERTKSEINQFSRGFEIEYCTRTHDSIMRRFYVSIESAPTNYSLSSDDAQITVKLSKLLRGRFTNEKKIN